MKKYSGLITILLFVSMICIFCSVFVEEPKPDVSGIWAADETYDNSVYPIIAFQDNGSIELSSEQSVLNARYYCRSGGTIDIICDSLYGFTREKFTVNYQLDEEQLFINGTPYNRIFTP